MADTGGRAIELVNPGKPPEVQSNDLGVMRVVEMFRRRLWVIGLCAGVVFMIVAFMTASATKMYTSTAQVEVDVRQSNVVDIDSVVSGLPQNAAVVDTETQILASRSLAGRVVDTLNLVSDPEFNPPPRPGLLSQIATALRGAPAPSAGSDAKTRAAGREAAIGRLQSRVRVTRVGMTYIINISTTSSDPAKAARLADAFAELYLTQQLEHKYDTIARANEWLSNRLESLREEVLTKERAVEAYRASNGLLSSQGSTLTEQAISSLNLELVQSRAALAEREARLRGVEEDLSGGANAGENAAEALGSSVIASLRGQQAQIARTKAELSTKYGAKHPEMQRIQKEEADVAAGIRAEVDRIIGNLRNEVEIARRRVNSIESSLGRQETDLAANNVGAVKLRELEREADASRTLYEAFLNRFKQVAEQSGIEQPDAKIVARASPGYQTSPNARLNLILGLVMGLTFGAVCALALEMFESAFRTPQDVQDRLDLPCLGSVPFLDKKTRMVDRELVPPESFVLKRPLSAFGEALRSIRASVFFSSPDRKIKVLAVTSALPEEGKTTTAVGLARISALAGSKTVLVDCDLRRRSATHVLGLEAEAGLTEVLFNSAALADVIQKDPGSGCDVVPLAQAEFTPRDLFSSDAMRRLVAQLRAEYDVVILDTAPVLPLADTRVLAPLADTALIVTRWGRTPASVVRSAVEQLRAHGASICGVVLEGVETNMVSRLLYDGRDSYSELYQTYYIR